MFISHCRLILMKNLVIFRHGHAEDDGSHILKTMNPLLSLRPLATNVKQSEFVGEVLEEEERNKIKISEAL